MSGRRNIRIPVLLLALCLGILTGACEDQRKLMLNNLADQTHSSYVMFYDLVPGSAFPDIRFEIDSMPADLIHFISDSLVDDQKCSYEGKFVLRNKERDELKTFEFSLEAGCEHVRYLMGDARYSHAFTPEGLDWFRAKKADALEQAQKEARLADLSWMFGDWMEVGKRAINYEWWDPVSGKLVTGGALTLAENGDTLHRETVSLVLRGPDVFYIADVPHNDAPVEFKMVKSVPDTVVFENLAHDWPQRIRYVDKPGKGIWARVEGEVKGEIKGSDYYYTPSDVPLGRD